MLPPWCLAHVEVFESWSVSRGGLWGALGLRGAPSLWGGLRRQDVLRCGVEGSVVVEILRRIRHVNEAFVVSGSQDVHARSQAGSSLL